MFAFALAEIFSIMGDFGLHEYSIREFARRPELLARRLPGILGLKTVLSCLSAAVMIALVPLLGRDPATSLAVTAFALAQIGYSWYYAATIAYSVKQDLHIQALLWLLQKFFFVAAGVAVILAGRGFVAVAFSNTLVQFAGGLVAVAIVLKKYGPFVRSLDYQRWLGYLKAALPFGLIVAFYLVYFRVDSVMISFFRGDAEVGQYNAAYSLASAMMFAPAGLVAALFPRLAGTYRSPGDNLDAPFQRAARWLLVMSLPLAVGGWLLADQLMVWLLGATYLPAASALKILAWTLPVWFITFLQGNLLTIIERQKSVAVVGFVNMTANVVLNLIIIPRYGFAGAAATTLATEVIGMAQMFYLLRRNITLTRTALTAASIGALSALTGALIWQLRDNLHVLGVILIATVFYGTAVMGLKIIRPSELKALLGRGRPGGGGEG